MSKASNYYYEQLNKEQQKAYYAMKEGLLNQQDSFAVPMLDKKELSDIYFMVRMDCPEIFYSVRFSYRYYPDSTAVEFYPGVFISKRQNQGAPSGNAGACQKACKTGAGTG